MFIGQCDRRNTILYWSFLSSTLRVFPSAENGTSLSDESVSLLSLLTQTVRSLGDPPRTMEEKVKIIIYPFTLSVSDFSRTTGPQTSRVLTLRPSGVVYSVDLLLSSSGSDSP